MTGQRIKQLRKKKNLAQCELAVRSGFTQSKISKIERGILRLKLDDLIPIAKALGVTVAELLDEEEQTA
ncbi:helix-turn-helix transcriptional regulator [Aneurinibacillus thermoaerophilus]|uniref:helix-turn-helix domain-containing protein n=1 Tax=Aneurinibacillus thermoaerophilus TaxID=143495 RepID=UPI002E1F75DF|nr:helix-turn-helix transcriptional regulator [Aneurinibacillus thermoaerophilus]MED0762715.1 helix-turn-helix transcriptional regulator [Aneurinibacillus thermoaerophilus]